MTDVLGTGTRAWRAEKPSGRDRAGTVDYKALGAEILHSASALGLGIAREPKRGDSSADPRRRIESFMTWGCRVAWLAVFIAVARVAWYLVMKL